MTTLTAPITRAPSGLLVPAALGAAAGFAVLVTAAGLLDPGYSPRTEAISALSSTESQSAGLMTAGFLCLATAALASGWALLRTLRGKAGKAAAALVVLAGSTTAVCGFARQSCSTLQEACQVRESAGAVSGAHVLHNLAGLVTFALLVVAGFLLASALRRDTRFAHLSRRVRLAAVIGAASFVWFGSEAYGANGGLVQRLMVLVVYGLPIAVALLIHRSPDVETA